MEDEGRLGHALLQEGLISEAQLAKALDFQRATGGDLKDILVKLGFVRDIVLTDYIARQQHMHAVDPEAMEVDDELMSKIPRDVIERHQILALKSGAGTVLLALSDPNDFQAIDEIQFLTSRPVESALAPRASIRKVINLYYQRLERSRASHAAAAAATAAPATAGPAGTAGGPGAGGGGAPAALVPVDPEAVRAVQAMPSDTLLRALVLTLIEAGRIPAERLLAHAAQLEGGGAAGGRPPGAGRKV
jgi:hypothetical protein